MSPVLGTLAVLDEVSVSGLRIYVEGYRGKDDITSYNVDLIGKSDKVKVKQTIMGDVPLGEEESEVVDKGMKDATEHMIEDYFMEHWPESSDNNENGTKNR